MKQILDNFAALGRKRLAILAVTALLIVGALTFGLSAVLAPNWRPIAGDLSASEGAAMVGALEQAGYQPRVSADGSLVSLPEDQIARARMALAEAGVAAEGLPGWELFDTQSGIGMNTFLQRVNRLRALEGELARSVQTLDVVEQARVHLVLPEREAFSSERPEATAAVIIRTRRGMELERKQALAVRSLVAAALPGLSPSRVTVLSASGETILSADGESPDGSGGIHAARIAIEERLSRNIEQMLSARVGAGNVRVRVAAELATAREVIRKESFDPEGQVAREVRSSTEANSSSAGAADGVDVLNNIPGGLNGGDGEGSRSESRERAEDQTRFEIGSTRSETVIEPGGVRRLSVAVLVNGMMVEGAYQDRPTEELERLASLVRSTMGFDEARGDFVTVDSLQFIEDGGLVMLAEDPTLAESLLGHIPSLVRWLIALAIVALIVFFAVRPALARLSRKDGEDGAAAAADGGAAGAERKGAGAKGKGKGGSGEDGDEDDEFGEDDGTGEGGRRRRRKRRRAGADGFEDEDGFDDDYDDEDEEDPEEEYVSLASVSGTLTRRHLEELGQLVEKDNEAALRQIRVWLNQKE